MNLEKAKATAVQAKVTDARRKPAPAGLNEGREEGGQGESKTLNTNQTEFGKEAKTACHPEP